MAAADPWRNVALSKARAFGKWLWSSVKHQWIATALLIPLGFFVLQTHVARQEAKEARVQAISVDRISKIQDSGKALDLALAGYYQSISQLGLAEHHLRMPGTYRELPVADAQEAVVSARSEARKALQEHASDVQRLRGNLDEQAADRYMTALAAVSGTVESGADISRTGQNITVLSRLVVARNALVNKAWSKVG